jgi:hypothetical protein
MDGDAHGVKNLDQHKYNEQLIEHHKRLGGDGQVKDAVPEQFAGVCTGRERSNKKQHREDGVDDHLGFA